MDDNSALLSETKKIVKSIIIQYKTGIKMKQFCNDYYENEGKHVPYNQFGYHSLIDFFKSIPDVLRMSGSVLDPQNVIIYPVQQTQTETQTQTQTETQPQVNGETMINNIESILSENKLTQWVSNGLQTEYYKRFKHRLPLNWIDSVKQISRFEVTEIQASNVTKVLIALKLNI